MRMRIGNLKVALSVAIRSKSAEEHKDHGEDFESTMVRGWRDVLDALHAREEVRVVE
jgi:hypothetical protein